MKLKVCGVTRAADLDRIAGAGADLFGLWHGVPGGHANIGMARLAELSSAAHASGRVEPVLVTVQADPDAVRHAVERCGISWIQLHGYQLPAAVRALRSAMPRKVTVVKALHIRAGRCPEQPLVRAYDSAGVDVYLLDAVGDGGRIGSTGRSLAPEDVLRVVELTQRPFLLAGGLTAANATTFAAVTAHPSFLGIDVDSGARDETGRLDGNRISAIRNAWSGQYHTLAAPASPSSPDPRQSGMPRRGRCQDDPST